jgi:phospholipid-transporting ATPase
MSDDFVKLVSQANPSALARSPQYHGLRAGYPPASGSAAASPHLMDPFFDDEDELDGPDSAFGSGQPPAMQSKESGLPLRSQAAPIAGVSKTSLAHDGQPQGWNFDDDDMPVPVLPTVAPHAAAAPKRARRSWRWPWQKEPVLTGERTIAVNTPEANVDFLGNHVSTSKYNSATFLPKFFFGASRRVWRFGVRRTRAHGSHRAVFQVREPVLLVHGVHTADTGRVADEQVDDHRPFGGCAAGVGVQGGAGGSGACSVACRPGLRFTKYIRARQKRHQSDAELNARLAKVLTPTDSFELRRWKDIHVGDVVRLENDDFIPADLILVTSSEPEGFCYIETSNLDGCVSPCVH